MRSFVVAALVASAAAQTSTTSGSSSTSSGSNSACTQNVFTISSSSDLSAITGCSVVSGTVNISPALSTVDLGGITAINGDLNVINNSTGMGSALAATTSISAGSLQTITGTFTLTQLTQLNNLAMPALTRVGGISFRTLPVLQNTGFSGVTQASTVSIFDTQLQSLSGINLRTVDTFAITQNRYISVISLNQLTQVRNSLIISANAANVAVSLPALTSTGNFTIQQVGNLSINALRNVTGSIGLQQNQFTLIQAQNLSYVTGDLFITNNTQLQNVSMPNLQTVSGFQIANNTRLSDLNFPSLTTVAGAIDWSGSFATIEVPNLRDVRGGLNVQTTSSSFQCPSQFRSGSGVVKGTIGACRGSVSNPTSNGTVSGSGSGSGSSGSGSSGTTRSGAEQLAMPALAGALGLLVMAL